MRRLNRERDEETRALSQGLTFLHIKNMPMRQLLIEAILSMTGMYSRGRSNATNVQVKRNNIWLPHLPKAFDGFRILHLTDLHADMSMSAISRVTELIPDLPYDLCVLTIKREFPSPSGDRDESASR